MLVLSCIRTSCPVPWGEDWTCDSLGKLARMDACSWLISPYEGEFGDHSLQLLWFRGLFPLLQCRLPQCSSLEQGTVPLGEETVHITRNSIALAMWAMCHLFFHLDRYLKLTFYPVWLWSVRRAALLWLCDNHGKFRV